MATSVAEMAMARANGGVRGKKRESLSVVPVKPAALAEKPERLDKTQGIQDSDYRVRTPAGTGSPVKARAAVPLDVFDYEQLERVEFLASGAFSHVFSAQYRGKSVVVKLLREQYKESHVTLKQMRFEQTLLSQLYHPNIVEFVGTGVYNGVPFTVLERLDETLNQRISGEVKLTMLESLTYAKAIGEALIYLHEEALPGQVTLHRDLKPDNLAFSQGSGAIKLIDFGLARSVPRGASIDEVYEMTGETGSLRYMAPEVALGMLYNAKADVYSLSLITWQMVQGTKPFQGMSRKDFFHHVVHRHFRPPVDPKWPPALSALIVRSWDPDQLKRPTAREYVASLEGIMDSLTHARHRRNSTGTSASGLARVRSMLQMMKERAEDYVVGAGGGATGGDRRRSSVVAAGAEQQQQQAAVPQEQQQSAAQRRSSGREHQQPQAAPVAPAVVRRQPQPQPVQAQQPQPMQVQMQYADGKVAAAAGAPDGGGQLHGEGEEQDGHKRRASF